MGSCGRGGAGPSPRADPQALNTFTNMNTSILNVFVWETVFFFFLPQKVIFEIGFQLLLLNRLMNIYTLISQF